MAAQDPNKGGMVNHTVKSGTCGCSGSSNSVAAVQSKDLHPSKNDDTPKVRKPYTITKQREKWTEEEHQKFLEALKLYGRGWRQIEEHVGTKTAVQIRSHAQKFFSKVVRESNGHSESSVNPIEIPPPRPKRKPVHPYPRKSIDSWRGTSISNQYERSPSPNLLVENQSPTSVLSTFASDSPRSDVSEQLNGCASATSCTSEMHSVSLPSVDKENEYVTSNSSLEEEKRFNLGPKVSLHMQGEASATTSCTSIMLFGKTVLVTDSNQPSPLAVENVKPLPETCQERLEIRNEKLIHAFHSKQLDAHLSIRMDTSKWKSLPSGAHVFSCMESNRENSNSSEGPPNAPLHWLALYQGSPVVHLKSCYQSSMHRSRDSCLDERLKEKESLNNRSCTGSIAGSLTEVENRESLDVDLQCTQAHHEEKCNPHNGDKGFVSYKRCFAEREMISSVIVSEEQERQRARVCS